MSQVDQTILIYKTLLDKLEKELELAKEWEKQNEGKLSTYKPKYITKVSHQIIRRIYKESVKDPNNFM